MKRFSVSVLGLFAVIGVYVTATPVVDPECTVDYLDKCGKDIFLWAIYGKSIVIPTDEAGLEAHCERQTKAEECVRKRSEKCHSNMVKGFSRLLYDANHEEYEQRCDKTSEYHSTYLKLAPCLNEISDAFLNCTARFILSTQTNSDHQGSRLRSIRERIPRACCSFAWYSHCAEMEARNHCDEDTATFVKEYLHRTSGELLDFACGSYTADASVCKRFDLSKIGKGEDVYEKLEAYGVKTMLGALSKLSASL